jgi:hypothetical protein
MTSSLYCASRVFMTGVKVCTRARDDFFKGEVGSDIVRSSELLLTTRVTCNGCVKYLLS